LTTLPVATRAHALEVVRLYRLRWRIEEVFRILKSNGLKIEDSQLETADRLFNLAAFGLVAAARIIQLVDARDGSTRPATDVIEADDIKAAAAISATLEGGTEHQKNPHKKGTLAWLSRIAARLGGWNCYYKPPGPKTMARGLDRLIDRIEGFRLANERRNV
jgi:Transposase DDE domain